MSLFDDTLSNEDLFFEIYRAANETDLESVITDHPKIFSDENWYPLNGNENNFGVIENQQAAPIPALIEKITNSIDAILTKKCLENSINPKSSVAPQNMVDAIEQFFPNHKQWDLSSFRKEQSEDIQIIADGPRMDTSLIIYDNGEGQHPGDFESTFLSLLRGNKNEIKFVQGKYNMGGSGAIVFCGKKRYHLIASRKFDNSGDFGFTLIRKHPLSDNEQQSRKNTWYEFLKVNGETASFKVDDGGLDLGLYKRNFSSGTILKLYSYDLPASSRSVISRDLNQSINEYLFEPALPIITVDKKERYPDDRNLERDLFGLKRRLEEDKNKYVDDYWVETAKIKDFGEIAITCYLFKTKIEGKTVKESRETIAREFFKNNMSVLFALNGQVQGHFTTEFISRTLKMQLLKSYLLIHVDCTKLNVDVRNELFMASRDRLKNGEETSKLRDIVGRTLLKGKLKEIYKRRKDSISFEGEDKNELIKSFTKNLPLNNEIMKLLNKTFKLEEKDAANKEKGKKERKPKEIEEKFNPQRFPSFFKLGKSGTDISTVIKIPLEGEKTFRFTTDVVNDYFVRVEEPGELKVGIINTNESSSKGGETNPKKVEDIFNVIKGSPENGTIKIVLNPNEEVKVGDEHQVKVTLTSPEEDFDQIFLVRIVDPEAKKEKVKKNVDDEESKIGLPNLQLVYRDKKEGEERITWEDFSVKTGEDMSYENIVYPLAEGDVLQEIFINMDSNVIKNYKSALRSEEQFEAADKRYFSSVYFHTLFLFTINKNKKYSFKQMKEGKEQDRELVDYIREIFESYYAQFLLNFGMSELVQSLGE